MKNTADWWLGQLDGLWFNALESAVREEWGVDPLRIREGGVSASNRYPVIEVVNLDSLFLPFLTWKRNLDAMRYICQWARARYVLLVRFIRSAHRIAFVGPSASS